MEREPILLVYDRECPACHAYCQRVKIKKTVGDLHTVDARKNSVVMNEITAQGLNIDQGMVLKMGGKLYYGADAMHTLATISDRSDILNRFNYRVFKSNKAASFLYPLFKSARNLLLKILGKKKIHNLKTKKDI
jgi:predicted DCC family thiol-disulfide oxidoreductase YuxK